MAKGLTGPQLKFCEGVVDGKTQVESYRAAYPKAKEASIQANATRLMGNDGILLKIAELRAETATEKTLSRREKREFLARVVRAKLADINPSGDDGDLLDVLEDTENGKRARLMSKAQAIALDNKMAGHDEPIKVEVSGGLSLVRRIREAQ